MKTLLALLLLIPSLSWGKEVALKCDRAEEYLSESGINETYILNLKKKTVENILSDGSTVRNTSIIEITNSLIKFKKEGYSSYGIGGLNRYTLELTVSDRYNDEDESINTDIYYQCEILGEKKL